MLQSLSSSRLHPVGTELCHTEQELAQVDLSVPIPQRGSFGSLGSILTVVCTLDYLVLCSDLSVTKGKKVGVPLVYLFNLRTL